jgi:hypothetical protein
VDIDMDEQNNIQEKECGEGILPLYSNVGKARPEHVEGMPTGRKAGTASPRGLSKKTVLLINGLVVVVAATCFIVIGIWIPKTGPFFDAPLRSFLTGLGLLGLACPPFTLGFIFQKKAALSPYYEEAFIRTGFYIVGFVCLIIGLICIGLSVYALIMRMFEEEKQPLIFTMSLTASNLKNSIGYLGTILKATSLPI